MNYILYSLFSPFLVLLVFSFYLLKNRGNRRLPIFFCGFCVAIYIFATPVSTFIVERIFFYKNYIYTNKINNVENYIVVLTAGNNCDSREYFENKNISPSANGILRGIYGYDLSRRLKIPLIISGGGLYSLNESNVLYNYLKKYFKDIDSAKLIQEPLSTNTSSAAQNLTKLVGEKKNIILVTDFVHMRRAKKIFQYYGFNVTPAATNYVTMEPFSIRYFLPNSYYFYQNGYIFHELLGILFFELFKK